MANHRIQQYLSNLEDERDGVALYTALAELEQNPSVAEIYRRFAEAETRHAQAWEKRIVEAGGKVPPHRLSWKTRLLIALARRFGIHLVLPTIAGTEQMNSGSYRAQEGAAGMAQDEASHARLLQQISGSSQGGLAGGEVARIEGRHRSAGGNALRAAVLGANDGLCSNLSLVMGVAGAQLESRQILITGLAGLLAGACSMALGEWLSVQSSRELYQKQLKIEATEIDVAPEEETEELTLIYQSRGLKLEQARLLAEQIMQDRTQALETLAREELNIDPTELGGSANVAATTSFLLFAAGAIIPVAPFIFFNGRTAVISSLMASTIGLFTIGGATSLFTGRSALFSGTRMVLFGLAAAGITFAIGRLIGINVTG